MNKRTTTRGGLLVAAVILSALGACAESERPVASGKGTLRAINAIISAPGIIFRVEEEPTPATVTVGYKDMAARRIDDLSFNLNFETVLAGDNELTRVATQFVDVAANTEHVFALTGALQSPTILTLEYPERQWDGSETVFEGRALHLAQSAGALDVYYAAPGTAPVSGEARGSIAFGEVTPAFEAPAGDYELILTAQGDPADVLYRSRTVTQAGAASVLYSVFDPDPALTGTINVRVMGSSGSGAELVDADAPPTVRLLHAAFTTGNVDLYANDDFSAPVIADVPFAGVSGEADYSTGTVPTTLTPAGDTGVLLLEEDLTVIAGTRNTLLLVGPPATLELLLFPDNPRPVETFGKLRVMQASANISVVDFYLYPTGGDINDFLPRFPVAFRLSSGYASIAAGDYEIAATLPGEKDIIAGPLALPLAPGDVVEAVILDTQDPNVLDLLIYDRSAL